MVLGQNNEIFELEFVEESDSSFCDETDLVELLSVVHDCGVWRVNTAVHVYNDFIHKSSFAVVEEGLEALLEVSE